MSRHNSVDLDSPDRPFDNIINFRDVGRSVNQFCRKDILKEGVFYRSARLDDASERDKRRLAEELHIHTVIDLRSKTEHQMGTRKRRRENAKLDPSAKSPSPTGRIPPNPDEHLPEIPGSKRALVNLTGKGFERALISKLDWLTYLKTIGLVTTGYRSDAVRLVCGSVMQPRGLTGLAQDTLDSSMGEIRSVFEILACEESYPTLVHCTQGKDRTGLVVLLVLLLVGSIVPVEAIVDDYGRSELELVSEFEERLEEIRAIGLGEDYTRCPPGFVSDTTEYLEHRYGGVRGYLEKAGVTVEMQERVRMKILA
ncbi:Tyrosine/serine protein phosphatase, putative [Penicillium digitatum]|uniref:Tyrosine/serine protein phosphatase, putative n=2 Tax=Penicillium digitatum TaxID=36651 RepID=K9FGX7_PEND1|nr:Tyrosine/serine protein phosphatase, putative [Penicillium digitatum Pd1]EKV08439.1 Tyrosine/serine protein phosphatase, putative [Penicillium digitatum Pd1]QQK41728.1 Tyrosine/serine protein phosphatase, putative [Penicillium digitatum]